MAEPYDASSRTDDQLREDAANAAEDRAAIAGDPDRDEEDKEIFDTAGDIFSAATAELDDRESE